MVYRRSNGVSNGQRHARRRQSKLWSPLPSSQPYPGAASHASSTPGSWTRRAGQPYRPVVGNFPFVHQKFRYRVFVFYIFLLNCRFNWNCAICKLWTRELCFKIHNQSSSIFCKFCEPIFAPFLQFTNSTVIVDPESRASNDESRPTKTQLPRHL